MACYTLGLETDVVRKGCHPLREFPVDSANVYSFSLFAKYADKSLCFILKPAGFEINIDDEIVLLVYWEVDLCFYPCTFGEHGYFPGTLWMIN